MAEAGDEGYIGLAGAGHVKNRQAFTRLKERTELVEATR